MTMRFNFTVDVEVERVEGKFAGRDELIEQIRDALEGANPGDLTGENEGQYEVTDWTVEEAAPPPKIRKRKRVGGWEGAHTPDTTTPPPAEKEVTP